MINFTSYSCFTHMNYVFSFQKSKKTGAAASTFRMAEMRGFADQLVLTALLGTRTPLNNNPRLISA